MLSPSCNFFNLEKNSGGSSRCYLMPLTAIKSNGIYDMITQDNSFEAFLMHCSGSQENMIANSDFSTYSYDRKLQIDIKNRQNPLIFSYF